MTQTAEWRAAGTDLSERRRSGVSQGPLVDIVPSASMGAITQRGDGGLTIGASVTIAALARDAHAVAQYPGVTQTAAGLATPQIRAQGTVGGNLAQRTRCWYYRHPHLACLKKGGTTCPARNGNHPYGVLFDRGPCVAVHPSSLGAAFLCYDATVVTNRRTVSCADFFGNGSDAHRDNTLGPDELIERIELPSAPAGEAALYRRVIGRTYAEWPLVEGVVRGRVAQGQIRSIGVAIGGVAPVPLRLAAVEAALVGTVPTRETIAVAAKLARDGANPSPQASYKGALLEQLLADLLSGVLLSA